MGGTVGHHADFLAALDAAVFHADQDDDAEVLVVPAIHQEGLERGVGVAGGRREAGDQGLQHAFDVQAGFGGDHDGVVGGKADDVLDLLLDLVGLGGGEVHLVEDGDDLVLGV